MAKTNKHKKISAIALILALLTITIPAKPAKAAETDFEFDPEIATITKYIGAETNVTIPPTISAVPVKTIGERAFEHQTNITNVTIPYTVETISDRAFSGCAGLKTITIPDNVTTIGNRAFFECKALEDATIGNGVTKIGEMAFSECESLKTIDVRTGNQNYSTDENGVLLNKAGTELIIYPPAKTETTYTIPPGVGAIRDRAFMACKNLKTITIGGNAYDIGEYAFERCENLKDITIHEGVYNIGNYAFAYCNSITDITIPDGVETIPDGMFYSCENLRDVEVPDSVTTIGKGAFYKCEKLLGVKIPDGVKTIEESTFAYCGNLLDITIPDSVRKIGNGAFAHCISLWNLEIPGKVTEIGENAFLGSFSLSSITIPENVEKIGEKAFSGCTGLKSVTILTKELIHVGPQAFDPVHADTKIYVETMTMKTIVSGKGVDGENIIISDLAPDSPPPNTIPGAAGKDGKTIDVPITVDTEIGEVTIELDAKITQTLIENALEAAEADAPGSPPPTITLDLTGIKNATTANLTAETLQTISDAGVALQIKLPSAEITLPPETLATLATTAAPETPITITAAEIPKDSLHGMQAAQARYYETVTNITIQKDGETVNAPLAASLPYTMKPGENPAAVRALHMDEEGNLTDLKGTYDEESNKITFAATQQSLYITGYDPVTLWENKFSDVTQDAWYYDAVAYAVHNNLFEGQRNGAFAPQASMTRAMFVAVLYRMGNTTPNATHQTPRFPDVPATAWYSDAVNWAAVNGITHGNGDGTFAPEKPITRQEIAVMLANYADNKTIDIPEYRPAPNLTDTNQIAQWAAPHVEKLIKAGVLNGTNGQFKPQNAATRAETAQILKNYQRFVAIQP